MGFFRQFLLLVVLSCVVTGEKEKKSPPTFKHKVDLTKYKYDHFVEIYDDEIVYNPEKWDWEGYINIIDMIKVAHAKQKFKNGILYLKDTDTSQLSDLSDPHSYFISYNKIHGAIMNKRTGPGYSFHSWPSAQQPNYTTDMEAIMRASHEKPKYDKLGWVGNIQANILRQPLPGISAKHPDIFDFKYITPDILGSGNVEKGYVSLVELTKTYQYLLDVEGKICIHNSI